MYFFQLKSTHSMRSATFSITRTQRSSLELKSTHSMRSATAILYRNIVFLHRLHLFFWTNCFVSKKYYCFFKSFPLSNRCESPSVFMFTSHSHYINTINSHTNQPLSQIIFHNFRMFLFIYLIFFKYHFIF